MKKLLMFLFFLFWALPTFAQVDTAWVRRYNGPGNFLDRACAIAVDASGNVYVTGESYGSGTEYDYATIKYYSNGDTAWVRRYNGSGDSTDAADAITVDASGSVYVTGQSWGSGTNWDYTTIKYYSNGDTAWVRRYNGQGNGRDYAEAIAFDASGNVYVTGWSEGSGTSWDYTTIKYYSNGDTAWVRRYDGPATGSDYAYDIAVDGSGNVYVTGSSSGSGTYLDYATIKYYPNGDTAWVRTYHGPGDGIEGGYAIAVDASGNVYVTGSLCWVAWRDYATIRYYSNGDTAWVRTYNGPKNGYDDARAIGVDASGNVCVTGHSEGSGTGYDYATIKYYSDGDTAWVRRYNGPGNGSDRAGALVVDASGNVYVTGYSWGSGANWDYATIKYYSNGDTAWVRRYDGPVNGGDLAFDIAIDASRNVYVTGNSHGGATRSDYATIKYVQTGGPKTLVLKDGSDSHDPIANKTFKIYKVENNPPDMTETYLGNLSTDGEGKITLPEGWLSNGDWFKVERVIHREPAFKPGHEIVGDKMYRAKIDNAKFGPPGGAVYYDSLSGSQEQEVIVDHTTIMHSLIVSVEWDASAQFLDSLAAGFRFASNYLYDVTDGQAYLDTIAIYDNRQKWVDTCDFRVYADNSLWPANAGYIPGLIRRNHFLGNQVHLPRILRGSLDYNINMSLIPEPNTPFSDAHSYRTKIHEFGHYALGFWDEYVKANCFGGWLLCKIHEEDCSWSWNYGFMDFQYPDCPNNPQIDNFSSEMSSHLRYPDDSRKITQQYYKNWFGHYVGMPCWDRLELDFELPYDDGIFASIIKPTERELGENDYFEGPNESEEPLSFDVGKKLEPMIVDYNGGAKDVLVKTSPPQPNLLVWLAKPAHPGIVQGLTATWPGFAGRIRCLGVNSGDAIWVSGIRTYMDEAKWTFGTIVVDIPGRSYFGNMVTTFPQGDSIEIELSEVQGHYLMTNYCIFESANSLRYRIHPNRDFPENPMLRFVSESGQTSEYTFTHLPEDGYEVTMYDSLGSKGTFMVLATDDSSNSFFVDNKYSVAYFSDTSSAALICGPSSACELYLDSLNSSIQKVIILSSFFPPKLNGLDSLARRGGAVVSTCAYPNIDSLGGANNYLSIRYSDTEWDNNQEATLEIFKWNESLEQWEELCGSIDTVNNLISANITSLGVYAAFTTGYLRGDANGDGAIDIADVVYLVNYLFIDGPAPDPMEAGDANCDDVVNIADVVYLVNYLFLEGPPPDCE